MKNASMLVVEAAESVAQDTEECLRGLGYAVCAAVSSENEAVAMALETHPQVVLVALAVEDGFDGIEVARQIGNLDIPVLLLTDGAESETLERASSAMSYGYVLRPIEERQLRLAIENALRLHRGKTVLVERSRRLSRLLDNVDAAMVAIDSGGFINFVNPLAESLLERRQAELSGVLLSDVFAVDSEEAAVPAQAIIPGAAIVSNVLQGGAPISGASATLITSNRQKTPVSFHAAPLRDAQRNCVGAVVVFRPGTKAQQIEHELQRTVIRQQSRLRLMETVFESLSDGVVVADENGYFLLANPSAWQMVGGLNGQGRPVSQWSEYFGFFHSDESTPMPSHELPLVRAMRGEATDGEELFIRNASKPEGAHLSVSGSPLQGDVHRTGGGVIVMRDITERKATEKKLQETVAELSQQTQLMQAIFDAMSDGVVVADEQGQFTLFNPAAERIVGMGMTDASPDQWTAEYGIFYNDRATPVPTSELPLVRAMQGITSDEMDIFIRNASKPEGVHLSVNGRPILANGAAQGGVIIFRDVTDKVLAEEALAKAFAQGRLEVLDTNLHNVGNAVNSVAVGAETLREQLTNNPLLRRFSAFSESVRAHQDDWGDYIRHDPQGRQVLPFLLAFGDALGKENQQLLRTVGRVNSQANHIVDILRTQRSLGRSTARKSVNLRQVVSNALKILQEGLSGRGVRTHLNFGNVPQEIWVEESQFQQMLVNLFKNAMEATDELRQKGGPAGLPRIELRAYVRREFLVLDVIDNGIGIARENIASIFRAGYTTKADGSGLGLHSAANFINASGGKIQPLSDGVGQGATMRVMLRLSTVRSAPEARGG